MSPPVMEAVKKMIDYMKEKLGPEKTVQVIMDMIEAQATESGTQPNITQDMVQQFIDQPEMLQRPPENASNLNT